MMLLFFAALSLAAFTQPAHLHPHCTKEKTLLLPTRLSEIQGKWHLISSAFQREDQKNVEKQTIFGWMEIYSRHGMNNLKYGSGLQGQIVIYENENITFVEEDGSVKLKDKAHRLSSQIRKMSDDCMVLMINNDTDSRYTLGELLFCRSHNGNHADREAFKTYSDCKELAFMVERQSYFNYETECDSVTHIMDPLDPKTITGRWHMVARASLYPTLIYEGRNPWVEFSWEEEKLKILEGHGNLNFSEEEAEVKGRNIVVGKANSTYMTFYQECEECLLLRTENHLKMVALHLLTRSGQYSASQMKIFHTSSRCLTLPTLYKYDGADLQEEVESQCDEVQHIVDPLDPSKITGKWLLVGKATTDPDVINDDDDHWMNLSWDGENLKVEGGNSTFNWSVREVEVRGPKIIHKDTGAYVTQIPTCMDCLLMKTETTNKKVELYFFTRSGTLTESEIKKFKANACCLHLPNAHVYGHAKPHIHTGSECDSMRHILDVFVPNKISGKWHLVAKAHPHPGPMDEEEDPWVEYSWEGQNLTIKEGRGKYSWPVKEIEVRGPKIVIQKENSAYVTFHPTCEDCLLMKTTNAREVVLNMFTRSGKLAASEIKTFKDNAHCVNLSNVLVYKSAALH